jgi:hypothetical protein
MGYYFRNVKGYFGGYEMGITSTPFAIMHCNPPLVSTKIPQKDTTNISNGENTGENQ